MNNKKYKAFISYSHSDEAWAKRLHKALETYSIPKRLVGQIAEHGAIPKRLSPIFRDREELPSATDLGQKVELALKQSSSLIVSFRGRHATTNTATPTNCCVRTSPRNTSTTVTRVGNIGSRLSLGGVLLVGSTCGGETYILNGLSAGKRIRELGHDAWREVR